MVKWKSAANKQRQAEGREVETIKLTNGKRRQTKESTYASKVNEGWIREVAGSKNIWRFLISRKSAISELFPPRIPKGKADELETLELLLHTLER